MNTPELCRVLFFVADEPVGRALPDKIDPKSKKPMTGPWRDTHKVDGRSETDNRPVSVEMIARHLDGSLLQSGQRAMLMPYLVDASGMAVATAIDLDIAGKGHAHLGHHFETVADALAAVRELISTAVLLGLRVWVETTKGGSKRVWVFHHRLAAADARDLGILLLKRANLNPAIEVFPKQATASSTGNGVFLPYYGGAHPGRQIITNPLTGEAMTADEFMAAATEARTSAERVAAIVNAARACGEISVIRAPVPRSDRSEAGGGETGDVSPAMWPVQTDKCTYLQGLVERAESGQELAYDDWLNLATHLKAYGAWGRQEYHRLSEFDSRYDPVETDHKFDSLTGGPRRCDKTPCGKDAHTDCGLPEKNVSSVYWAYRGMALKMAPADAKGTVPETEQSAGQTTESAPWESPVSFTGHDLPAFPVEALPRSLAEMVTEVAASVQVAPEMPAMLALAVVAAASARRCLIQVGRTHSEPLNLFVAVTGEPGERKSAVVEALAEPIRIAQQELSAEGSKAQAAAQEARTVEEARLQQLRADAAKEKDAEKREALVAALGQVAAELTVIPALPRLLADDTTPEKLASMMADQGGTMAILSAEGGLLDIIAGRYSDGKANMDIVLKGHSGESVLVDRKGGASLHIPRARLTLGLAVQPDVLSGLTDTPSFRGRGLLGRFLYCLPQSKVGSRLYQNRPISAAARTQYNAAILTILSIPLANPEDASVLHILRLEGAALDTWAEHANNIERRQVPGGDLSGIRDWASKLAGAVARIAGGFHLVENSQDKQPWNTPVSLETVLAAWAIGEYLIPHAQAAFGLMGADPAIALAKRLLAWIEREKQPEFSLRDCHRANRAVGSPKALEPGLILLCERGFLRLKRVPPRTGPGQPASPIYEVNPEVNLYGQNGQNTQK